jgi:cell division protein ZapA
MKQLEVQIMGQPFVLGCPEGQEERLTAAVRRVDEEMSLIRDAGKVRSRERIAVLAAVNLVFALDAGPEPQAPSALPEEDLPGAEPDAIGLDAASIDALVRRIDQALV